MTLPTHPWKRNRRRHAEELQELELAHYARAIPDQKMLIEILADYDREDVRDAVLRRLVPYLTFPLTGPAEDAPPIGVVDTMDLVSTESDEAEAICS